MLHKSSCGKKAKEDAEKELRAAKEAREATEKQLEQAVKEKEAAEKALEEATGKNGQTHPSIPSEEGDVSGGEKTPVDTTVTVSKTKLTKLVRGKKKMTVKWKKVSEVTGYQIQYSLKKGFESGNRTKAVRGAQKTSVTVAKLKQKKVYYVRIRAYKKVGTKTCYSGWSAAKSVKVK